MSDHPLNIIPPSHPDDALMMLCFEVEEAHKALDELSEDDWRTLEYKAAHDAASDARARLIRTPARTLEGALAKAAAVAEVYRPEGLNQDGIEQAIAEHGISAEALLVSLMADLYRLQRPDDATKGPDLSPVAPHTLLTSYRTWLEAELRTLEREAPDLRGFTWTDCRAWSFFRPDAPPPSTRAAHVLDALGIDWRADVPAVTSPG